MNWRNILLLLILLVACCSQGREQPLPDPEPERPAGSIYPLPASLTSYFRDHPDALQNVGSTVEINPDGTIPRHKNVPHATLIRIKDPENQYGIDSIDELIALFPDVELLELKGTAVRSFRGVVHSLMSLRWDGASCLTDLDLSSAKEKLRLLSISGAPLRKLDLSGFSSLADLSVADGGLTELNLEGASSLWSLSLSGLPLERLDISDCKSLQETDLSGLASLQTLRLLLPQESFVRLGENRTVQLQFADLTGVQTRSVLTRSARSVEVRVEVSPALSQPLEQGVLLSSTDPNPYFSSAGVTVVKAETKDKTFSVLLEGLMPATTYHVRGYFRHMAGDKVVTLYGDLLSFELDLLDRESIVTSYVDLGLSVMWADQSIGMGNPDGTGETLPPLTYAWGAASTSGAPLQGSVSGNLDRDRDAATVHWKGGWRLPTREEVQELLDNCDFIPSHTVSGGFTVRSRINGRAISLPPRFPDAASPAKESAFWTSSPASDPGEALAFHASWMNASAPPSVELIPMPRETDLEIRPVYGRRPGDRFIAFRDPEIRRICTKHWDTDGDGELSEEEAAAVTDIGLAFKDNISITSFDEFAFFTGLKSLQSGAFSGSNLVTVTFPAQIRRIPEQAFAQCLDLQRVELPDQLTDIGVEAFSGCGSLEAIQFPPGLDFIGAEAFRGCRTLQEVILPSSTTRIRKGTFQGCSSLAVCPLPETVVEVEEDAFQACSSLKALDLPPSVRRIGPSAFSDCSELASLTFSGPVEEIGESAFARCGKIISFTLPAALRVLGNYAFAGCRSLGYLMLPGLESIPTGLCGGCTSLETVYFSDDTRVIGSQAFISCPNLKTVLFPKNLETIQNKAFSGTSLSVVSLGEKMVSIGESAFESCVRLKTLSLASVKEGAVIGKFAFRGCTSLGDISLGEGWRQIANQAFSRCTALPGIVLPESAVELGRGVFEGCVALTSVHLPAQLSLLNAELFKNCSLTEIVLPSRLIALREYALSGTSIERVVIPSSVISVDAHGLYGLSSLKELVLLPKTPPAIPADLYDPKDGPMVTDAAGLIRVYIPKGTRETYLKDKGWGHFAALFSEGVPSWYEEP